MKKLIKYSLIVGSVIGLSLLGMQIIKVYGGAGGGATSEGLVGYWDMDDNNVNGTTVYDKSGQGNNATLGDGSTPTTYPSSAVGKLREARSFDGGDYMAVTSGDLTKFEAGTLDFTISVWVKQTSYSTQVIAAQMDANDDGWRFLSPSTNGRITCSVDAIDIASDTGVMSDAEWHLATCVIDRDGNGQMYIDGVASGSAVAINSEVMSITSNVVRIGRSPYDSVWYWNGSIDEVKIYNRALSATEVLQNYNSSKRNYVTAQNNTGLVGQWTLADYDYNDPVVFGKGISDDLTAVSSPTLTTGHDGRANTALLFDGSADYLTQKVYYDEDDDDGEATGVLTNGSATVVINDTNNLGTTYDGGSGDNKYMIVLTDSGSEVAWGYLGTNSFSTPSNTYEIYSTKTGTTQNYSAVGSFSFSNTPITYEIRKTDFQITGALTLGAWVNYSGIYNTSISKWDIGLDKRSYILWSQGDGYQSFRVTTDGITTKQVDGITDLRSDGWHFATGVYSPSSYIRVYVDGVLENENTTSIPASLYDTDQNMLVGTSNNNGLPQSLMNGSIQSPFIYNRALSASEVAGLYESQKKTFINSTGKTHYIE